MKGHMVFSIQDQMCILDIQNINKWNHPACVPLPNKSDSAHHPTWMPTGQSIIFEYSQWANNGNPKSYLAVLDILTEIITEYQTPFPNTAGKLSYPKWSPSGRYLALLESQKTKIGKEHGSETGGVKSDNVLVIVDNSTHEYRMIYCSCAEAPLSWSSDSKEMAFQTVDGTISIYNIENDKTTILGKGGYPVFHPGHRIIYYIAPDKHLYNFNINGKTNQKIDGADWSWRQLIDISKDGTVLYYVSGRSFLWWEYNTINYFNLISHKDKVLSNNYSTIHGASLVEK
jgi:hypothetical protein